jgi:hypothetical protein
MAGSTTGGLRRRLAWTALLRVFKPGTPGLGKRLAAVPRMIAATVKGEYDGAGRLTMMVMSGLYIISPIDVVPEMFLFLLGLVDDAAETERFLEWEKVHKPHRGRRFAGGPPPNVPPTAYKDAPYTPSYTVHPRPTAEDRDEPQRPDQSQRKTGRR